MKVRCFQMKFICASECWSLLVRFFFLLFCKLPFYCFYAIQTLFGFRYLR